MSQRARLAPRSKLWGRMSDRIERQCFARAHSIVRTGPCLLLSRKSLLLSDAGSQQIDVKVRLFCRFCPRSD